MLTMSATPPLVRITPAVNKVFTAFKSPHTVDVETLAQSYRELVTIDEECRRVTYGPKDHINFIYSVASLTGYVFFYFKKDLAVVCSYMSHKGHADDIVMIDLDPNDFDPNVHIMMVESRNPLSHLRVPGATCQSFNHDNATLMYF